MLCHIRRQPRVGFTLIELLVVIGIMALLAALVAAGVGKVRDAQMGRTTDQTLVKLQLALDQQWKAVVDQAREDHDKKRIPQTFIDFCDKDKPRAAALWTYASLRLEFPQTFDEAQTNVLGRNARKTFAKAANPAGLSLDEQSAVLLYLILSESSSRGVTFAADDVTTGAQGPLDPTDPVKSQYTVFKDAWGAPIRFERFAEVPDLALRSDSIDPLARLSSWTSPNRAATEKAVFCQASTSPLTARNFDGKSKRVTVIAAGSNKAFEHDPLGTIAGTDDHYGYRLTQQGNKGD